MEKYNKVFGGNGERAAEKYLSKKNYKILERNFNVRGGEVDIVAQKGEFTVFVEVKTRQTTSFGTAAEAVTYTKKQRLIQAANCYILKHGDCHARFDVIEVYGEMRGNKFVLFEINHIENAFM